MVMGKISGAGEVHDLVEVAKYMHRHGDTSGFYWPVASLSKSVPLRSTNTTGNQTQIFLTRIGKSTVKQDLSVRGNSRNDHHREELQRDGVQGHGEGGGEEEEDGRGGGGVNPAGADGGSGGD